MCLNWILSLGNNCDKFVGLTQSIRGRKKAMGEENNELWERKNHCVNSTLFFSKCIFAFILLRFIMGDSRFNIESVCVAKCFTYFAHIQRLAGVWCIILYVFVVLCQNKSKSIKLECWQYETKKNMKSTHTRKKVYENDKKQNSANKTKKKQK